MGFYDELGQAAGPAAGLAALGPIGGIASIGAGIFGGLSENKQRERERRTQNDALRLQAQELALRAAAFNRGAPGARMTDAVRGDVLAGVQPYQLTGEGRTLGATGGLTPALISAGTRQLGQEAARRALLSELGQSATGPRGPDTRVPPPSTNTGPFHRVIDAYRQTPEGIARWREDNPILPLPDPYTFLPWGGFPVRGGSHSLWPDPFTGEGRPG